MIYDVVSSFSLINSWLDLIFMSAFYLKIQLDINFLAIPLLARVAAPAAISSALFRVGGDYFFGSYLIISISTVLLVRGLSPIYSVPLKSPSGGKLTSYLRFSIVRYFSVNLST